MNCSSCNHGNRDAARFCEACGSALAWSCGNCGTELRPGARFCDGCGDPLDQPPPALLDTERQGIARNPSVRGQAQAYTPRHLADEILQSRSALEGERKQVAVLFGAPIAYEDHAQRACSAALALRDELRNFSREVKRQRGLDFATRIGINSGDVVVGRIGDDLRLDYTAQGHTVGLA